MDINMTEFEYFTMRQGKWGGVDVLGWGTYPNSSVLAGQPMKVFLDNFSSEELALSEYPSARWSSHWTEPQVSLAHLPGEDDPVTGGMYMDDLP